MRAPASARGSAGPARMPSRAAAAARSWSSYWATGQRRSSAGSLRSH